MNSSAAKSTDSDVVRVRFPVEQMHRSSLRRSTFYRIAAHVLTFVSGAACLLAFQLYTRNPETGPSEPRPAAEKELDAESLIPEVKKPPIEEPPTIIDKPKLAEVAPAIELSNELRMYGITEPASGRFVKLPLATSQAVAFVDVKLGDQVKKGWQVFSHWESPERLQAAKAELARTKKMLEVAQERSTAASKSLFRVRTLEGNVISAEQLQSAESTARIRQRELEAAELTVAETESRFAALQFEFKQAFVTSPIDGVVTCVDVVPGERRQLGGTFRGVTILDSRVLSCRCQMNQDQIEALRGLLGPAHSASEANPKVASPAKPISGSSPKVVVQFNGKEFDAELTSVGIQADANRMIPIVVEFQNPDQFVACGIQVQVVFQDRVN